ncbi:MULTISPECIES: hypothetical protein [unclassified Streptomyces]|uniref:hypothetical protein n=1 Tax=unclassified Streptomyces TaxID=2593676 RepID=UPI0019D126D2|nr:MULTISPECIES: hypothetical protein [unclassified Streptomyces]
MQTDLSTLTTAAGKWESMAGEFKKLEDQYRRDVHGASADGSWVGLSANAAKQHFDTTLGELQGAQQEAKSIAGLLRDAHTQFVDLRGKVQAARADAVAAGMKVSDQGVCHYDFSKVTAQEAHAIRHDPGFADTERSWTEHIQAAVKAVTDADDGVRIALNAVVVDSDLLDGTMNGFNRRAKGDVEVYEAENALDIATRLNSGEKVSVSELQELQRAFRDNTRPDFNDRTFSQTFLNSLGAAGTVKLSTSLDALAYLDDKGNKTAYLGIKNGFADTLAHATKDSEFAAKWREGIKAVGTREFDGPRGEGAPAKGSEGKIRGYQAVMGLVSAGDPESFDAKFLSGLANDIYDVEKDSKGNVWDINQLYRQEESSWFVNDPLDSALGMLSHHPDEATRFLDPGGKTEGSRLEYLLKERDWNGIVPEYSEWGANTETSQVGYGRPTEDSDARIGFGAALEAATTGRDPNDPAGPAGLHDEGQARIMHETIELLDREDKGDSVPENLKVPLGRALADYTVDAHEIISGDEPLGSENISGKGSEASIANSKDSLIRVMRGVSDGVLGETSDGDPVRVFDLLYEAQRGYAAEYLSTAADASTGNIKSVVGDWDNKARDVAMVSGAMNAIGSDMILDDRDTKIGRMNDVARYAYHGIGGALTPLPVFGDAAQRIVDAITYEWSKDVAAEHEDAARGKVSEEAAKGITGTYKLIDEWGESRDAKGTVALEHAKGESRQSYIGGRSEAYDALRTLK